MRLKMNKFIAATSLIEIMIIFFIIGIVSAAGMSLTKPKNEYMKKVAIYAAYRDLSTAAANIKNQSYIDFSTDLDSCPNRNATSKLCPALITGVQKDNFPKRKALLALPKVSSRAAFDNTVQDLYITQSTNYSNLSAGQQKLVKFYQSGFCQRLAAEFNLSDMNNNCPDTREGLVDDSGGVIQDFTDQTPALYLPNGYVYYIGKFLYASFGTQVTQIVNTEGDQYIGAQVELEKMSQATLYPSGTSTISGRYYIPVAYANIMYYKASESVNLGSDTTIVYPQNSLKIPNETRLDIASKLSTNVYARYADMKPWARYVVQYLSENKDYFNVYIDINGKMSDSNDITRGPDKLNEDVFLFHVYRNGTVKPAYESGFPLNYLTGGVNYKITKDDGKMYRITYAQYAQRPLGYAQCIAGTAGDPRFYYKSYGNTYKDNAFSPRFCDAMQVYANCYPSSGVIDINKPACGVTVNKPSFFVR